MGHWDEHMAVQTFISDIMESTDLAWMNSDLLAFMLGVAQHEIYDLVVNERPVQVQRIDFAQLRTVKEEMPAIYLNLVGIGISLWKSYKRYSQNHDKAELRQRLLGLLGAITPDILEGIRLAMLPDALAAWNRGDASLFHLKPEGWRPVVDTSRNRDKDLERRELIQGLTVSLELFNISF